MVESGVQKQITKQDTKTVSRGQYTFVADGVHFTVDWVADENGYVTTGDQLPRAPSLVSSVLKTSSCIPTFFHKWCNAKLLHFIISQEASTNYSYIYTGLHKEMYFSLLFGTCTLHRWRGSWCGVADVKWYIVNGNYFYDCDLFKHSIASWNSP